MNLLTFTHNSEIRLIMYVAASLMLPASVSFALTEETFNVLQIGSQAYQNVTVTTKAKTYIVIMHSMGMNTIKVKELPVDLRVKLGYPIVLEQEAPKHREASLTTWT